MTHSTLCTRCARSVPETDLDARFKHGEVIACSACEQAPVESVQQMPETDTAGDSLQERIKSLEELTNVTEYLEVAYRDFKKLTDDIAFDFENSGEIDFQYFAKLMSRANTWLNAANSHLETFKKREGLK